MMKNALLVFEKFSIHKQSFGFWILASYICITCVPLDSPASSTDESFISGDAIYDDIHRAGAQYVFCWLTGIGALGGLVFVGADVAGLVKGERARAGWQNGSYVIGALSIVAGMALAAGSSGKNWILDDPKYPFPLVLGISAIGIGVLDIGLALWNRTMPEKQESVVVSPLLLQDSSGRLAPGVGLRLVLW